MEEETGKQLKDIGSPSSVDSRRAKKKKRGERERERKKYPERVKWMEVQIAVAAFRVWSRAWPSGSEFGSNGCMVGEMASECVLLHTNYA